MSELSQVCNGFIATERPPNPPVKSERAMLDIQLMCAFTEAFQWSAFFKFQLNMIFKNPNFGPTQNLLIT